MGIRRLLSSLAKQKRFVVEKEMPLHGFKAGQVFHFTVTFLVVRPDVEGALHQQFSKIIQIALKDGNMPHTLGVQQEEVSGFPHL